MVIQHLPNKTRIFEFGARPGNKEIMNFYINNQGLLKQFGMHFIQEAQDLIIAAEKELVTPTPCMTRKSNNYKQSFIAENENCDKSLFYQNFYPFNLLSPRESQCFRFLILGYSIVEISKELSITSQTTNVYLTRIKEKLGCKTYQQLLHKAHEVGLVEYTITSEQDFNS
jgi:DNA-binding CsgD family transcriptional regulator